MEKNRVRAEVPVFNARASDVVDVVDGEQSCKLRVIAEIVGLGSEGETEVAETDVRLIKEKTYRYRDDSVPFLRNIQNIGVGGSYLELVIEDFFR